MSFRLTERWERWLSEDFLAIEFGNSDIVKPRSNKMHPSRESTELKAETWIPVSEDNLIFK